MRLLDDGRSLARRTLFATFAAAAALFVSCSTVGGRLEALPPLQGMVYDAENRPVGEVEVQVDGKTRARTDVNGRFVVVDIPFGEYEMVLKKKFYEDVRLRFEYDSSTQVLYAKMISADQLLTEAETALEQRRWAETRRALDRCLALQPDFAPALYLKATLAFRQGDAEGALGVLLHLLDLGFDEPFVHLFLADIYQDRLGDEVRAAEQLRMFLDQRYDLDVEKRLEKITNSSKK